MKGQCIKKYYVSYFLEPTVMFSSFVNIIYQCLRKLWVISGFQEIFKISINYKENCNHTHDMPNFKFTKIII